MSEYLASILENLKTRVKNPIVGSVFIAWIAFNWKPLTVLFFSDETIYWRIDCINTYYLGFWVNFGFPALSGLFIPVVISWIGWGFNFVVSKPREEQKKIKSNEIEIGNALLRKQRKQKILEEEVESIDELKDLNKDYKDRLVNHQKQIDELINVIDNGIEKTNTLENELLESKKAYAVLLEKKDKTLKFFEEPVEDRIREDWDMDYQKMRYNDDFPVLKSLIERILNGISINDAIYANDLHYLISIGFIEEHGNEGVSKILYTVTDKGFYIYKRALEGTEVNQDWINKLSELQSENTDDLFIPDKRKEWDKDYPLFLKSNLFTEFVQSAPLMIEQVNSNELNLIEEEFQTFIEEDLIESVEKFKEIFIVLSKKGEYFWNKIQIEFFNKWKLQFEEFKLDIRYAKFGRTLDLINKGYSLFHKVFDNIADLLFEMELVEELDRDAMGNVTYQLTHKGDFFEELYKKSIDSEQIHDNIWEMEYAEFRESDLYSKFEDVGEFIKSKSKMPNLPDFKVKDKFFVDKIVEEIPDTNGKHRFTEKGNFFWKKFLEE